MMLAKGIEVGVFEFHVLGIGQEMMAQEAAPSWV